MPCLQKAIAGQFLQHFYGLYDGNDRSSLAPLYTNDSKMTFEGTDLEGQAAIIGKLTNLGFQAVQHDLATARLDCQVTKDQGIYILVTGVLSADGAPPMAFCETFILHQNGASWYIHNQIFRLNLT